MLQYKKNAHFRHRESVVLRHDSQKFQKFTSGAIITLLLSALLPATDQVHIILIIALSRGNIHMNKSQKKVLSSFLIEFTDSLTSAMSIRGCQSYRIKHSNNALNEKCESGKKKTKAELIDIKLK